MLDTGVAKELDADDLEADDCALESPGAVGVEPKNRFRDAWFAFLVLWRVVALEPALGSDAARLGDTSVGFSFRLGLARGDSSTLLRDGTGFVLRLA